MTLDTVIIIVFLTAAVTAMVTAVVCGREIRYLDSENRMLRRLLSEQAKLHQMSLDAYIAMLREAQRHTGGQKL